MKQSNERAEASPKSECSNEILASRAYAGDQAAAEQLLMQNTGYLNQCIAPFLPYCEEDDLLQEARVALLEAARTYEPSTGAKFLTYATPGIHSALLAHARSLSASLSMPMKRYLQLRKVAYLCAEHDSAKESELLPMIQESFSVSKVAALRLLNDYRVCFLPAISDADEDTPKSSALCDPARIVDQKTRERLLLQDAKRLLSPREWNLIRYHLGIGDTSAKPMSFRELAALLNYSDPSGAQKAYRKALQKIRQHLYEGEYGRWLQIQHMMRLAASGVYT